MTYNFDPDRWYENERAVIESQYNAGTINEHDYKKAITDLERRYYKMLDRLDGSYQLPK
jgi:hypothetical protein